MIIRDGIRIGNISDVGQERSENEDYFAYYEPDQDDHFQRKGRLTIVADGMGGMAGGYAASRIAVEEIMDQYTGHPAEDPREALKHSIEKANAAIQRRQEEDPSYKGMGTTATAMVLKDGYAYFAQVGDSRAYLIRQGTSIQLTEDQTKVRRMLDEGILTEEEAEDHPEAHILSQAVGHNESVDVDISIAPLETQPGDKLMLCSDGLHGQVSDQEMADVVSSNEPNDACHILVDLANQRGGPDNITVQIIEIVSDGATAAIPQRPLRPPSPTIRDVPHTFDEPGGNLLLKVIIGVLLVALVAGITMFIYSDKEKKEHSIADDVETQPSEDIDGKDLSDKDPPMEEEQDYAKGKKKPLKSRGNYKRKIKRSLDALRDETKRDDAAKFLCSRKIKGSEVIPPLKKALETADTQVGALLALECMKKRATPALPVVHWALVAPTIEPRIRRRVQILALRVLGNLRKRSGVHIKSIIKIVEKNKIPEIRKAALVSLGRIAPRDKDVIKSSFTALGDKHPLVREEAAMVLSKSGDDSIPLLKNAIRDPDDDIRKGAFLVVKLIGKKAEPICSDLIYLYAAPENRKFKKEIRKALKSIGKQSLKELVIVLKVGSRSLKPMVIDLIGSFGKEALQYADDVFTYGIHDYTDPKLRLGAFKALIKIGKNDQHIKSRLISACKTETKNPEKFNELLKSELKEDACLNP